MHGWLTRLLERHGNRYLSMCLAIAIAEVNVVMIPMSVLVVGRYEGLSFAQSTMTVIIAAPLLLACMAVGLLVCRPWLRLLQKWCSGDRDPALARETALAAHSMPLRFLGVSMVLGLLIPDPVGTWSTVHMVGYPGLPSTLLLLVGGSFFAVWGIVVFWVWLEVSMRPIIANVSAADPTAFVVPRRRFSVNMQLLLGISAATFVGALFAGALTADRGSAIRGLQSLLEVTFAVSVLTAVPFVALFGTLILAPVRELTVATGQVADGDLDAKIPLSTNDELGDMAASFNAMVDGLRDRSRLREENSVLVHELRDSRERIVTAGDLARKRVEQDLHDGAQQMLVLIRLKLGLLARAVADQPDVSATVHELREDIDRALSDLRDLAHGIYPAVLDSSGLPGALEEAVARAPVPASLDSALTDRYRPEVEAAVYFSCLEALQNAAKHAGDAASVVVRLSAPDGHVVFEVTDNGRGFDPNSVSLTSGLQNLADRIGAMGGSITVDSQPGRGTSIIGSVPVHGQEPVDSIA